MAIYGLFSWLDYGIYSMVKYIVRLIILVANYDFFSEGEITKLADRVYVVLGVLMLFKIVISAVQYMVNPDTFDDKDKGMAGILKKTVICMALLVVIRPIFSFAINIQQTVVQTIPGIVMGNDGNSFSIKSSGAGNKLDEIGDLVAGTTIKAFVSVKKDDNGNPKTVDKMTTSLDSFANNIMDGCDKGGAISKYFNHSQCNYDYMWGISTAAGLFLLYVLISMTLDVGIRTIKLGIIQILAPIPISSYMVSKDNFNKFVKTSVKVYLDLFIRLIVIYFIIFFIRVIVTSIGDLNSGLNINGYQADGKDTLFIRLIIICALFMFAKNAPKFISDLLGLDSGGFSDMADMFKPAWQRSGLLGAGAGILGAGAANIGNKIAQAPGNSFGTKLKNALKNPTTWTSAVAGASSAGLHGLISAAKGKNAKEVIQAGAGRAIKARQNRELDKLNGISGIKGFGQRVRARALDSMGIDTAESLAENRQKAFSTFHQDTGKYKQSILGRIPKVDNIAMQTNANHNAAIDNLGSLFAKQHDAIERAFANGVVGADTLARFNNMFDIEFNNATGQYESHGLRAGINFDYKDLDSIINAANTAGLTEISTRTGTIQQKAQRELYDQVLAGTVTDVSGNLIDSLNVGDAGYVADARWQQDATTGVWTQIDPTTGRAVIDPRTGNPVTRKSAHEDITTSVGVWEQHTRENAVSLDPNARPEDLLTELRTDFSSMDQRFQQESARLSSEMATSQLAAARASNQRRDANKKENK